MTLPVEILNCFFDQANDHQQTAYLKIGSDGSILEWGGTVEAFGLDGIREGDAAARHLSFHSAIPDEPGDRIVLASVHFAPEVIANVHLYRTGDTAWVLIINQSREELKQQQMQQKLNELTLLYDELSSRTPEPALADTLCMLDFTVLERTGPNEFRLVGIAPPQMALVFPELFYSPNSLRPGDHFPFLDNFLVDAELFWRENSSDRLRSGNWESPCGEEETIFLEANAVSIGERKLLLIKIRYLEHLVEHQLIQKARETALSYGQLVQETQKKEILLHCIVHDLKGPLTSMVGALSCLAAAPQGLDEDLREFAHIGMEAAKRQEGLIADILDAFSAEMKAMQSFRLKPNQAPAMYEVADTIAEAQRPACTSKNINIMVIRPPSESRGLVAAEKTRLERVLSNLVENALRYSPRGTTIRIRIEETEDGLIIGVEDEGPGVPADKVVRLFEKFSQGGGNQGSAGLGLYFCKIMLERWGGDIGYQARRNGGSRFWFRLQHYADTIPESPHFSPT